VLRVMRVGVVAVIAIAIAIGCAIERRRWEWMGKMGKKVEWYKGWM